MNSNIFEGSRRTIKALKWAMTVSYIVATVVVIVSVHSYGLDRIVEDVAIATGTYVSCFLTFHFVTKGIGWIVRGFSGIPEGQDSK